MSLGQLYQKDGLTARAERVFNQLRALDPEFPIPKAPKDKGKKKKKLEKSEGNIKVG